ASPRATPRAAMASNSRARPRRGPPLNGPPPAAELAKAGELFKEVARRRAARVELALKAQHAKPMGSERRALTVSKSAGASERRPPAFFTRAVEGFAVRFRPI